MVYNYLLLIQYDGAGFAGWQKQKEEKTIQGVISSGLQKLCGHKINLIGAGRTDSGTHAVGQAANFKTKKLLNPEIIKKALNSSLFPRIYIKHVKKVSEDFHARYSARKKLYRYIILREPSPFFYNYSYPYYGKFSQSKMRKAAQYLKGKHNFRSFCDGGKNWDSPHFFRSIDRITISHNFAKKGQAPAEPVPIFAFGTVPIISVDIEGRSFLCHMVRIIVGTLIDVGRGALPPEGIKEILKAKDRAVAGKTLPAKGLFLMKVYY